MNHPRQTKLQFTIPQKMLFKEQKKSLFATYFTAFKIEYDQLFRVLLVILDQVEQLVPVVPRYEYFFLLDAIKLPYHNNIAFATQLPDEGQ